MRKIILVLASFSDCCISQKENNGFFFEQFKVVEIASVEDFIQEQENKNTRKKTEQNVSLLGEFLTLKGESRTVQEIPPHKFNSFLREFITTVRQKENNKKNVSPVRCVL